MTHSFEVTVTDLPPEDRTFDAVRSAFATGILADGPELGEVVAVEFDGSTAVVTVECESAEFARRMDGRSYEGLYP